MIEIIKKFIKNRITNSQRKRETSDNREVLTLGKREIVHPAAEVAPAFGAQSQGDRSAMSAGTGAKGEGNIGTGTSVLSLQCPYCASQNFVKRGTRQKKGGKTQLYICKDCGRTFTPSWTKNRQHSWPTILEAMSYYNLGFSLEQTCQIMKEKFQTEVRPSTVAAWMEQNKEICSYHRMRAFAVKHFSPYEVVDTCTLAHRQLYRFRYHRAKTKYILEDDFKHYKFYPLKEFLDNVTAETPHQYFQRPAAEVAPALGKQSLGDQILRASEAPLKFSKTEMIVRSKANYATKLTELVFKGVAENKARHESLQRFLIANDSVTVATEVPVYIRREDLAHMQTQLGFKIYFKTKLPGTASDIDRPAAEIVRPFGKQPQKGHDAISETGQNSTSANIGTDTLVEMSSDELPQLITGHIDFLQIRNGSVHILDYKSNAAKERPIEQLTLYALALSRLTGLRLFYFKCAWFDEKDYFEFFPLHVVYKPGRGRRKVYTKEGVYNMNEKMGKMESLRPIDERRSKVKIGTPNF